MIENKLTEKEQRYIDSNESTISLPVFILKCVVGFILLLLSSFIVPSAESKVPADNYLNRNIKRFNYSRYKKIVKRKVDGTLSEKDKKKLEKINSKPFPFDELNENVEQENIEKIYEEYLKEHENDSK